MKNIKKTAKKIIPAAVIGAALAALAVWGVLYGVLIAVVWLVFGAAMLLL